MTIAETGARNNCRKDKKMEPLPPIQPIAAGGTVHLYKHQPDHLTQVQHKYDRVEIVDHFDKDLLYPVDAHIVHIVDKLGNVDCDH